LFSYNSKSAALVACAALSLFATGCVVVDSGSGTIQHDTRSVDLKGAKSVRLEVEMGAGELQMRAGAASLMDADLRYRSSDGRPDIGYDVNGTQGVLNIRQTSHSHHIGGNDKNEWDLRLNEDVPMDIHVKIGAGEGRLNLGQIALHNLDVEMGAGELKLDLTGHPRNDMDVRVQGGVGEANIRLPKRARIEAEAHGGLGGITAHGLTKRGDLWVNEPEGESLATIHVNVSGGIGNINLVCE
jgi:hypothetical protein